MSRYTITLRNVADCEPPEVEWCWIAVMENGDGTVAEARGMTPHDTMTRLMHEAKAELVLRHFDDYYAWRKRSKGV